LGLGSSGRSPRLEAAALLAACVAFATFVATARNTGTYPDSHDYRAFADAIRSGELLVKQDARDVPRALATRTPGYPLLLAVADLALPGGPDVYLALHAVIGLLTLVFVSLALRPECPSWITAAIVLVVQWRMRHYFAAQLTEWTCFNGLMVLFAASVRSWSVPSYGRLAFLGFLCAFLILTRPAMIVVACLPPAFALLQGTLPRGKALAATLAPFSLILLWMSFNLHRMGSFTMTPFAGMNIVGVATLVGHAEVEPGDGPELATLTRELNEGDAPTA
jgi:hypothetical protein